MGSAPRHQRITPDEIIALEEEYPEALVLAHPECTEEVLAEADYIGSTKGIIEFTQKSDAKDFIIVTMVGVLREMELRNAGSGKRFHFAPSRPCMREHDCGNAGKGCRLPCITSRWA